MRGGTRVTPPDLKRKLLKTNRGESYHENKNNNNIIVFFMVYRAFPFVAIRFGSDRKHKLLQ